MKLTTKQNKICALSSEISQDYLFKPEIELCCLMRSISPSSQSHDTVPLAGFVHADWPLYV